ncbi:ribonucleotide reductase [Pectobacterium bacteriophage PM2]|uniref:Nucleotide reductase subunit C n=1 Tax=Pectobacterium bacteriophage PM2 TaxID=1429794 RepID=A0A0A0Q0K5_9CAUD|nr:ribonucleotide reductase [Pectobacterium bacteriophage PM2]AHY25043.1 hypothetical protein PM2_081 [Pectobacterium bacteriophage PM2]
MIKEEKDVILEEIMSDHNGYSDRYDFEDSEYLQEIEGEDWTTDNGKYQYKQSVYFSKKHNVHIAVDETRSGSYFSDWDYSAPDVSLVEKREKVVTRTVVEWVTI